MKAANTLSEARAIYRHEIPDLILLDVGLPDGSGYSFCEELRADGQVVPIIFLTARYKEYDLVRGLDCGGDDFLCKPFRAMELLSRIRALLRRSALEQVKIRENPLDPLRMRFIRAKEEQDLTPTEFAILQKIIEHKGQIVKRAQLLDSIWDQGGLFIDDNTLSVHISRLREKVGKEAIETVRGIGYRWKDC